MTENELQLFAQGAQGGEGGDTGDTGTGGQEGAPSPGAEDGTESREHWQRVDRIYDGLMQEAEGLRELFPDFDIRRELHDPAFFRMLRSGVGVERAFYAAHADELFPAAMAYAAEYTRARLASSMAGGGRPGENGLSGGGGVQLGSGVSAMSRADYDRICRMVERGERVSFG